MDNISIKTTKKLDYFLAGKFGILFFLVIFWIVFQLTFTVSQPISDLIYFLLGKLSIVIINNISIPWISALLTDGIISGVGAVIVFIPQIFILFFLLSFLEESKYMLRVAYVMDNFMHKLGLPGRSCVSLLMGFGCNVPGILATSSLKSRRERILTMLINPFMSCSARLPIYILFVGLFFPKHQGLVIVTLYFLGILVAILMGLIFKFILKNNSLRVIETLPPYKFPTLKQALKHMWFRGKIFIKNAGTIIFAVVVLVWVLSYFPLGVDYASPQSFLGKVGTFISPIFYPLGFGHWEASISLVAGFVAKEVVIGSLGSIYGGNLSTSIQSAFTPLSAFAFMVFVLLYTPCIATLGAIKSETKTWKWPLLTALYTSGVAWLAAFIVFQGGKLILGLN